MQTLSSKRKKKIQIKIAFFSLWSKMFLEQRADASIQLKETAVLEHRGKNTNCHEELCAYISRIYNNLTAVVSRTDSLTITGNTWIWLGQCFIVNYNDPFLAHTDQDDSPLISFCLSKWSEDKKNNREKPTEHWSHWFGNCNKCSINLLFLGLLVDIMFCFIFDAAFFSIMPRFIEQILCSLNESHRIELKY